MKFLSIFIALLIPTIAAHAQITRIATFDNFAAGQFYKPSFTDALSGIAFSNSTHITMGFAIDGDPDNAFLGSNYLTSGGGSSDGFGPSFGFTAALPTAADHIGMAVLYTDSSSYMILKGFNATGTVVAQSSVASSPTFFNLEIDSDQFNITSFTVLVTGGFEAYDNIGFTYLPEPPAIGLLSFSIISIHRRKKSISWLKTNKKTELLNIQSNI